jgi:hypothetical protein
MAGNLQALGLPYICSKKGCRNMAYLIDVVIKALSDCLKAITDGACYDADEYLRNWLGENEGVSKSDADSFVLEVSGLVKSEIVMQNVVQSARRLLTRGQLDALACGPKTRSGGVRSDQLAAPIWEFADAEFERAAQFAPLPPSTTDHLKKPRAAKGPRKSGKKGKSGSRRSRR